MASIPRRPLHDWSNLAAFLGMGFLLTILGAGHLVYERAGAQARVEQEQWLWALSRAQAGRIAAWLADLKADTEILRATPRLPIIAGRFLSGASGRERDELLTLMSLYQGQGYHSVELLDAKGIVRLQAGKIERHDAAETARLAAEALRAARIVQSEIHRPEDLPHHHLDFYVPLAKAGVLRLVCDPEAALEPLLRAWPARSSSGESFLVRREGNDVIFMTALRRRSAQHVPFRRSIKETSLPAALAVLGQQGLVTGRDYSGVPVLAALSPVPGTSWFLIAKIDEKESLALRRARIQPTLMFFAGMAVVALLVLAWLWRKQRAESRPPDIGFLRFVSRSLMNGFRTAISASSPGSIRPSC